MDEEAPQTLLVLLYYLLIKAEPKPLKVLLHGCKTLLQVLRKVLHNYVTHRRKTPIFPVAGLYYHSILQHFINLSFLLSFSKLFEWRNVDFSN